MPEDSIVAKISRNREFVSFHQNGRSHTVEAPADFLDYVDKFVSFKHLILMMLMIDQERLQEDPEFVSIVETRGDVCGRTFAGILNRKGYDKSKIPDLLKVAIRHYNNLYSLTEFESTGRPKMKFCPADFDFPFPVRPVFLRYFTMQMWSFMKYLQDLDIAMTDIEGNSRQIIKTKLAILVNNTVYTDKKIKVPDNINLTRYDLGQPQKLTARQMQYGRKFIRLSNSYKWFREFWLYLCFVAPDAAAFAEDMIYESAKSGWDYYAFRYQQNCGSGGSTKGDKHFAEARTLLHEYYLKLYKKEISRNALVQEMYSHFEDLVFSPKYKALDAVGKGIMNEKTISKYIKQWDKENGIDRTKFKKSTKPRIKTMVG